MITRMKVIAPAEVKAPQAYPPEPLDAAARHTRSQRDAAAGARRTGSRARAQANAMSVQCVVDASVAGKSLIAARGAEAAALRKLTTNWRTVVEANVKPLM